MLAKGPSASYISNSCFVDVVVVGLFRFVLFCFVLFEMASHLEKKRNEVIMVPRNGGEGLL